MESLPFWETPQSQPIITLTLAKQLRLVFSPDLLTVQVAYHSKTTCYIRGRKKWGEGKGMGKKGTREKEKQEGRREEGADREKRGTKNETARKEASWY